ncbi:DUF4374 domain-containing protein [Pseudochryseolinea flava]|uniref:DUF5074 domain-containing protein n=1 Tax=Pseudochryseolinea flava TaxID=2059302 RepID=A0A364Y4B0_9BACT|nr:DUF4374 domain-containing protein [Pseudochryseolinea flava]RAW01606.1 hypothetical protein DQQ10_08085 [Pseudochryseolinea flava]
MRKLLFTLRYAFVATAIVLSSCSDDNDETTPPDETTGPKYVILNASEKWEDGYFTAFDELPSGIVKAPVSKSLQVAASFGFRTFKNAIFVRTNPAGTAGLQKYTVNADGSINVGGFIKDATQFVVVDETNGFYLDEKRGTMKLQTFNPSTMERTGEVDLSSLRNAEISEYQVVGKHTLAVKEGKLYAGITYGTIKNAGYGDDVVDYIEFAVIDIAKKELEKTIKYEDTDDVENERINTIGWGSSGNKMWTVGDDGALYLYSTGLTNGFLSSKVIRIKKGETDFDKAWVLDAADFGEGKNTSIATGLVKNGKFYLELASEDVTFGNMETMIFDYYVVDLATGDDTKITGMPKHHYVWANEHAITEIDGNIYFWVRNTSEEGDFDGYYKLNANGTSATEAFKVDHDGFVWGFAKLEE